MQKCKSSGNHTLNEATANFQFSEDITNSSMTVDRFAAAFHHIDVSREPAAGLEPMDPDVQNFVREHRRRQQGSRTAVVPDGTFLQWTERNLGGRTNNQEPRNLNGSGRGYYRRPVFYPGWQPHISPPSYQLQQVPHSMNNASRWYVGHYQQPHNPWPTSTIRNGTYVHPNFHVGAPIRSPIPVQTNGNVVNNNSFPTPRPSDVAGEQKRPRKASVRNTRSKSVGNKRSKSKTGKKHEHVMDDNDTDVDDVTRDNEDASRNEDKDDDSVPSNKELGEIQDAFLEDENGGGDRDDPSGEATGNDEKQDDEPEFDEDDEAPPGNHNNETEHDPSGQKYKQYDELLMTMYGRLGLTVPMRKRMQQIWPRWIKYCEDIQREMTHQEGRGLLLISEQSKINWNLMQGFVEHLVKQEETWGRVNLACQFLQAHLKAEGKSMDMPIPSVNQDDEIKKLRVACKKQWARKDIDNLIDIQADDERSIEPKQMVSLLASCFVTKNRDVLKLSLIGRINAVCLVADSHVTLRRGDDIRTERYIQSCLKDTSKIGPTGTTYRQTMTREGKTNHVGRKTRVGCIPHVDPIRSASAWEGIRIMVRFSADGYAEPFPNFMVKEDFGVRPKCRGFRNWNKAMDSSTLSDIITAMYRAEDIVCDKLTHQGRRQAQQEMDEAGVPAETVARMGQYNLDGGRISAKQQDCYLTNYPIQGMVNRAGADHRNTELYVAPWSHADVPDCLVDLAVPRLNAEVEKVEIAYSSCESHNERKEKRLYMARGTVQYMKYCVKMGLRMLASRPMHPGTTKLDSTAPPIYATLLKGTHRDDAVAQKFLRQRLFGTVEWRVLVETVSRDQTEPGEWGDLANLNQGVLEKAISLQLIRHLKPFYSMLKSTVEVGRCDENQTIRRRTQRASGEENQTDDGGPALGTQRQYNEPSDASSSSYQAADELPLPELPPPKEQDVLARPRKNDKSTHRKRRQKVSQAKVTVLKAKSDPVKYSLEKQVIMSNDLQTLRQYWDEYSKGTPGSKPALRDLEISTKGKWRSDFVAPDKGTKYRSRSMTWWLRAGMYKYMEFLINECNMDEEAALRDGDILFNSIRVSSKTGKRNLGNINKLFRKKLKALKAERQGLVVAEQEA